MTDADGMDHPPYYDPLWERGATNEAIDGYVRKGNAVTKRQQLLGEVQRHEAKLAAAQRHLAALENIPDEDPFTDGTVLLIRWKQYTYAALRMRSFWYMTGKHDPGSRVSGPYRAPWAQFADWLVEGHVTELIEMAPAQTWPLVPDRHEANETSPLLRDRPCTIGNIHPAHVWFEDQHTPPGTTGPFHRVRCPGVSIYGQTSGATDLIDKIKADPNRQAVTDPPEAYAHPGHMRIGGWCQTCGGTGDPAFIHSDAPSVEEERIQGLTKRIALWKSVATQPLTGPVSESGIHVACGLVEKHGAHLWASSNGGLVTCEGRLADAPEKQD